MQFANTITIARRPAEVFAYLAHFETCRGGTTRSATPGKPAAARWESARATGRPGPFPPEAKKPSG